MRIFLAMDYAVNLISGYSCRSGWQKALEDNSKGDEGDSPVGRIVTIFGHPLLNEHRVFLHNGVANRVVLQNWTQYLASTDHRKHQSCNCLFEKVKSA